MPLTPKLIDAYENADYVVFAEPEFLLRIGERSSRLDELLEREGATTAAFITAANPRSEPRSAAENKNAGGTLDDLLDTAGYPRYAGEGRDPEKKRAAEPSVLVVGIYRANAEALGRIFGQNAIVFMEKGNAPELVVLA
ncbi:MAG TPA: DUF3293 domain-containing protein [Burkholderiales bacterium]|nr:DUF3293 domain-containing protein [Burkholderiales bacterium]